MNHDSHEKIFPADPRITAYALGELEGDELKFIEAVIASDPDLQAAVADLRGFGDHLKTALSEEPLNAVPMADLQASAQKKPRGLVIPFPLHYLATAAAACFAVVVWVRHENPVLRSDIAPSPLAADASVPLVGSSSASARSAKMDAPADTHPTNRTGEASLAKRSFAEFSASRMQSENSGDTTFNGSAQDSPAKLAVSLDVLPAPEYVAPAPTEGAQSQGKLLGGVPANTTEAALVVTLPPAAPAPEIAGLSMASFAGEARARQANRGVVTEKVSQRWQAPSGVASSAYLDESRSMVGESYIGRIDNGYRSAADEPLSTFSIDVDTASYANVRRFLTTGRLPPRDAVKVEELINYFPYRYAPPKADNAKTAVPFAASLEVASAPWAPAHRLVRIGLKGREFTVASRPAANLVFLIDVSGSMSSAKKLPLVKESLRLLVERLRADDRVAIVTYAGSSGLTLPSTPASRKGEILAALDGLRASGSTNGGIGIHLAYDIAKANFVAEGGINRVILCTDGDFNVGVTDRSQLVSLIEEKAKSRVFLSVFGFGMGNLKDGTLESLSAKGNGSYGYIDSRREAEKVFVEQVEGTLATIAKDVKIQVEFNPAHVASYRLIGYENRLLAKEDFNNDAVDAGDIGAGHTVTALYEIVPVELRGADDSRPAVDALKYQKSPSRPVAKRDLSKVSEELLTVKVRYKAPEGDVSARQEFPLVDRGTDFARADGEFQFAAAVAAWGMLLRDSPYKGTATFEQVLAWAEDGLGDDPAGHRAEFMQLVRRSAELSR